jgi:protein-disulfide isomerase
LRGFRLALLSLVASGAGALGGAAAAGPADDEPAASGRAVQMRLASDEQSQGRADAPLTLVEFTDYQCPYCRRFEAQTWPLLKRDYLDTGKLRFIVRDLPLEFHAAALPAAEAAHCAAEQGKFWPMHAVLLASGTQLTAEALRQQARALGLNVERFSACTATLKYSGAIAANAALAHSLGLSGTPAFIVGRVHDGVLQGWVLMGALPYEDFDAVLRELLAAR